MRLLLLSNSTNPGEDYLSYPRQEIKNFLGNITDNIVFIPFAAIRFGYDIYEQKVNDSLKNIGVAVTSIHRFADAKEAIRNASAIVVGGGNTWKLVRMLHEMDLMPAIYDKVKSGTPFIGWSAGSNIACPTLRTTNDMPIVDPKGFDTLNLLPFQINPHYLDANPEGHGGETREERILEFLTENQDTYVVGLREATMLCYENEKLSLIGNKTARIFKYGSDATELTSADDLTFLV